MSARINGALCAVLLAGSNGLAAEVEQAPGALALKSIGPIAVGPDRTLFVSDPIAATLHAVSLPEHDGKGLTSEIRIEDLGGQLAALLGTSEKSIRIIDLAVHPDSALAYVSVMRGQGEEADAVIVQVDGDGKLVDLQLDRLEHSSRTITSPPTRESGRRGADGRLESITDVAFVHGKVIVAGLSNEEFASTLRTFDYPFAGAEGGVSVEIYHGAHGKFETHAPVRTFMPYDIDGDPHIVAAYTCTPLVVFPLDRLGAKGKVKGKTVAELGNRNRPLDMISYETADGPFLLMANTSRGVMKIDADGLDSYESIQQRVPRGQTSGVPYETIEDLVGVVQLAALSDDHALVIARGEGGKLTLEAIELP